MALKAGYVGVKRWLYEKLQATTTKNVQDIADIWSNNNITNAKNLLPNNLVNKTEQSVTFTHDADGAISLSGTAGANVDAAIYDTRDSGELWRGLTLIVSKGLENANISIYVNAYNDTTFVKTLLNLASGTESGPLTLDYTGYNRVRVTAYVKSGTDTTGKKIYPMFRLATDPDDTYAPFAMTNKQLTDAVFKKRNLTNADDLNDIKTTGIYSATTAPANTPESRSYYTLLVDAQSDTSIRQLILSGGNAMYLRSYGGSPSAWGHWYKYTGTEIVPSTLNSPAPDDDTRNIEPEIETKTTRSTKKTATTKEGE